MQYWLLDQTQGVREDGAEKAREMSEKSEKAALYILG